jgi:hypothetical protein
VDLSFVDAEIKSAADIVGEKPRLGHVRDNAQLNAG